MADQSFSVGIVDTGYLEAFAELLAPITAASMAKQENGLVLGLTAEDAAVGVLAGTMEGKGAFRLLALRVAPPFRRAGGATLLLEALKSALDDGMPAVILAEYMDDGPESEALKAFLFAQGARENEAGNRLFMTTVGELYESQYFPEGYRRKHAVPVADLSESTRREIRRIAGENGLPPQLFTEAKGGVSARFSVACAKEGSVEGYLLLGATASERLIVHELWLKRRQQELFTDLFRSAVELFRTHHIKPEVEILFPDDIAAEYLGRDWIPEVFPGVRSVLHEVMIAL